MKKEVIRKVLSHINKVFALLPFLFLVLLQASCKNEEIVEVNEWLNVATFNIQYDKSGNWASRKGITKELFELYDFDLIGVQEPYTRQINDVMDFMPDYWYFGTNIQGTNKDGILGNYIIYKKSRLTLQDSGYFWYSETPDTVSIGWDAHQYRVCVWVKFKDLVTGKEFYHFNSHLDDTGDSARIESSKFLVDKISQVARELPVIATGDYNFSQNSEPYQILTSSEFLEDSFRFSAKKDNINWSTINHYVYSTTSKSVTRLDHIFFTNKNSLVRNWKIIINDFNHKYPSDHFPIMIHWELK